MDDDDPLARLDQLIAALTAVIEEPEEETFRPVAGTPPRRAVLRQVIKGSAREQARQPWIEARAILFDGKNLFMGGAQEFVRNAVVDVRIAMRKSKSGESFRVCQGVVQSTRRVSGGYEFLLHVRESRREVITAAQRLREFVEKKAPVDWERWCGDLPEGVDLRGVDLHGANLARFDLCCANLTGADLSDTDLTGTNLSGAVLERARLERACVTGADLFRARVPRRYKELTNQAGLLEEHGVLFCDD